MGDNKKIIIVDSMSNMEILELLRDDIKFLQHKIDENEKEYRRLIKDSSSKERIFYKPLSYKSSRGHYRLNVGAVEKYLNKNSCYS